MYILYYCLQFFYFFYFTNNKLLVLLFVSLQIISCLIILFFDLFLALQSEVLM